MNELFTLNIFLSILVVFTGTFLAVGLVALLLEKKILKSQQRQTQTHMLNLAIQDLLLNLWFTHELQSNSNLSSEGTYARYWFDGIRQLNLSFFSEHSKDYSKMVAVVHMMDVDNKKMDHGYFQETIEQADIIQSHLSSWVSTFNMLIQTHKLQIPQLPSASDLLDSIKNEYQKNPPKKVKNVEFNTMFP